MLFPPLQTLPLAHSRRRAAERAFGSGPFRKISWQPAGEIGACAATVARAIAELGGEPILGFHIHHWPNMFIEALPHYVWKRPDGVLVDLTEKYPTDVARHSVFSPYPEGHSGSLGPGQYFLLRHAPEVMALIKAGLEQARTRRLIEDAIRTRERAGIEARRPLLDLADAEEVMALRRHERDVAAAIEACCRLSLRTSHSR